MNQLTTTAVSPLRNTTPTPGNLRPHLAFERRERGFGVGYGNSRGYASGRRYTPASGTARFRFA